MDEGARLRVTLLGTPRVSRGGAVLAVPGARLRGLFVRLALAGGRAVEPGVLVDAVWGAEPPAVPAHALQTLVSRLRRALGPADVVVWAAGGYRLVVDPDDVDVVRFERLVATGRERLWAGEPQAARAALAEAVALWGERPGAEPAVVASVAPAVATRLAQMSIEAVADLADAETSLGRPEPAAARLTALLAEQPVHERVAASLLDALAAQGRQAEALTVYERTRRALADVLGADPGTALRERHLRLLRPGRPAPKPSATTLPAPLTSFVGRDDELARLDALLGGGRLVTVVGPGGSGKTRLALEAARRREEPCWLVDLASVTEPAETTAAVLAAVGPRGPMFDARTRVEGDELDVLVGELGRREGLLLVDNCEHVIDAAAHLVVALLSRCLRLRVLATSREPLAVDGETLLPLAQLALPAPEDDVGRAKETASVRLFTERAAAVRPGFDVDETTLPDVVRVVRGLDGLPLALELAAARLRTLALPDLADGLTDRFRLLTTGSRTAPPRHRTLRAVIAWSWDLLDDHERTVAERISILPGGVTAASATAVCAGTAVPPAEIPGLLAALVDRSLLQLATGPGRHRMLETIREYGADRLAATGDLDTVRDLAAAHFTELTARHDPLLRGPGQLTAMRVIGADYDNTLAALRHRCAAPDSPGAIALALNLVWYWQMFARHSDAAHWLGEALAVPGGGPSAERDCARAAYLLNRADVLPEVTGEEAADPAETRELAGRLLAHAGLAGHHRVFGAVLLFLHDAEAALPVFRRLAEGDDVWLAGLAHMFQAEITENAGALDRVRVHVEAALARFRQAGDRWGQAATLPMRARLRRYDDLDGAFADLREAGRLAGEFGSLNLGDRIRGDLRWIDLHLRRGDADAALALIGAARERASSTEPLVMIDACEAGLRIRLGDLDRADALLGTTALLSDHARTSVENTRAALRLARGDPDGAAEALREARAAALATGELPVLSLVVVTTAALAEARGRRHESAVLLGAAARLRGAHDHTDPRVRELTDRGRAALGEEEFASAYTRGWAMDAGTAATAAARVIREEVRPRCRERR
ncbi:AfsR/SARP family transcriptional regulator [Herbidospora sp. NEAU-GS84]|uniref:AfsR/SARP family transcriptional regulator n=1 Tax=Herbidospora solisilvae TaxID=2696284 RepID=A0A7C9J8I7_9ACTN|nr:BTAD domain-containing putative transcriptional regulator [Herbidospora solisilvae]NAS27502.1 AfsR/SARP family transcriptional regulator [Herbidospora solisilvae]